VDEQIHDAAPPSGGLGDRLHFPQSDDYCQANDPRGRNGEF